MRKKKSSHKSNKLSVEQEALLRQEKELRRKEALLKRRLRKLPAMMEERQRRQKVHPYAKTIHTTLAGTHQLPGFFRERRTHQLRRGLPMKEKRAAKIKFVILVLILTSLLILIWRSLPA